MTSSLPCRSTDPEVFHQPEHETLAKALCNRCELRAPCRQRGRDRHEWGVWGGETSRERAANGCPPRASRWAAPKLTRRDEA